MNQSDFENFILCLANYNNPDDATRAAAVAAVQQFYTQNFYGFLATLLVALQTEQVPENVKKIALIFANEALTKLEVSDSTITKFQLIEKNSAGLLNSYLTAATANFYLDPNLSANLFATLTIIFSEYLGLGEDNQIIQTVLKQLEGSQDLNFILASFNAFKQITHIIDYSESPEVYQPMLLIIFTLFGKPEIPNSIKIKSLDVLNNLIAEIDDVFENEHNRDTILAVSKFSINNPETKASGYHCISKILKHYFMIFVAISQEVFTIAIDDLHQNKDSEEIVKSICRMITRLCQFEPSSEEEQQAKQEILSKIFSPFFESLIPISMEHDEAPNEIEEWTSQTASTDAISQMIFASPAETCPAICQYAQENIQSNNPCVRELCLTLFYNAIIITKDASLIQTLLTNLYPAILDDPLPRVREASIYILLAIANLKNETFDPILGQLVPQLVTILEREIEFPVIASGICEVIGTIKTLPNPETVFTALLKFVEVDNSYFLGNLFENIAEIIKNTKDTNVIITSILPQIVGLVQASTTSPVLIANQSYLSTVFENMCSRAKDAMAPCFEELYKTLLHSLEAFGNASVFNLLSVLLKSVSYKNPEPYLPFLKDVLQGLLSIAERFDSPEHIYVLTYSLATLNDVFDLTEYLPAFTEALISIMNERPNDFDIYTEILKVFNYSLFKKYHENTDLLAHVPALVQIISAPFQSLSEFIPDYDETAEFIIQATHFLLFLFVNFTESQQWVEIALMDLVIAANCVDVEQNLQENQKDGNEPDIFTKLLLSVIDGAESEGAIYEFIKSNEPLILFLHNLQTKNDAANHEEIDDIFAKAEIDVSQLGE